MLHHDAGGIDGTAESNGQLETAIPAQVSRIDIDISSARVASQELLGQSGIARVICVDDCYAAAPLPADEFTAVLKGDLLTQADKEEIARISSDLSPLAEAEFPTTLAVSLVESEWENLGERQRQKILELIHARVGSDSYDGDPDQDPDAASRLREILARRHEYLTFTLHQWRARRSDLLTDGRSTLVLFDRDFTREGAAPDAGEEEVERLLSEAPENWRIGLLTHTVPDSDAELATWRTLSERFQGKPSRFLVIGKGRLAQAPGEFPRMLKLTLLAPALEQIQHHVHETVQEVWRQAHDNVRQIDPYTLEAALTGDRIRDGAWGPETLLRVTSAFAQDRVRTRLRGNLEVHEASSYISSLSRIRLPELPDRDRVRRELADIERLEYYDSPAHLNELCFPIEAGDIFALDRLDVQQGEGENANVSEQENASASAPFRAGLSQYLILLGQSCDLTIRAKGSRSNDLAYARIAPLKPRPDRSIVHPGGGSATAFDLPFFDSGTGDGVEVRLSQQRIVPLAALDFCAFNSDGCSRFILDQEASPHILPNWQKRFEALGRWVQKVLNQYSEMQPDKIPGGGAEALTRALTETGAWPDLPSHISVDGRAVHYGIRRVGRLREPYRSALLSRMAQREARDAFDPSLLDRT